VTGYVKPLDLWVEEWEFLTETEFDEELRLGPAPLTGPPLGGSVTPGSAPRLILEDYRSVNLASVGLLLLTQQSADPAVSLLLTATQQHSFSPIN
jgi:hypothetical protein